MMPRSGLLLITLVIGGLLVLGIWATIIDAQNWAVFIVEHDCKVVEKYRGSDDIGFNTNGDLIVIMGSDKTGWLCDDGITYWR